jgi:hypothetical protein
MVKSTPPTNDGPQIRMGHPAGGLHFAQAEMKEEVYLDPLTLFAPANRTDRVLRFLKSLYGLKHAPKTFYEKLSAGLKQREFTHSKYEACLFLKAELICVVYVDDTIFARPNAFQIAREIEGIGVSKYETQHRF